MNILVRNRDDIIVDAGGDYTLLQNAVNVSRDGLWSPPYMDLNINNANVFVVDFFPYDQKTDGGKYLYQNGQVLDNPNYTPPEPPEL